MGRQASPAEQRSEVSHHHARHLQKSMGLVRCLDAARLAYLLLFLSAGSMSLRTWQCTGHLLRALAGNHQTIMQRAHDSGEGNARMIFYLPV